MTTQELSQMEETKLHKTTECNMGPALGPASGGGMIGTICEIPGASED